jgi:Asp-tRNA(Asn)/Glu-tRNA(Gln) amidotransferase A subunit family amidase
MTEEIYYADAAELARRIRAKELSPVEVMQAHLDRVEAVNPKLNAIVNLQADPAMERAREAEAAIVRGESWGPLHGVPFTIKDCIDNKGVKTTRGSKLFEDYFPGDDATVVKRLLNAGGIFIGKTNMPEFALWWETGNLVYGFTENPWMMGRTAGGSSGGEASAIASGMSPLGMGSDVGGSIRWPAHVAGLVGLKPTHGRVPLTGHFPETLLRFMHVGPMARTVRDVALALPIIAGPDDDDQYASPVPMPGFSHLGDDLPKLKVGFCAEGPFAPVMKEIQEVVKKAAATLSDMGCEVEEVELANWHDRQAQDISMSYFLGEGAFDLDPIIKGRENELAPSMQRRLNQPRPSTADYYKSVQDTEWLRQDMKRYFAKYDLLVVPTSTTTAFEHDSTVIPINGQDVHGRNSLRITVPFDLTGSPAISVPFGWSNEGLPIGVQIVGRHFDEATVLHAAAALEAVREGAERRPLV